MKILMLVFAPVAYMYVINLVILYEKTGLKEVKEMYRYVIEKILEKFNEHLSRRGVRIGLLDFLAYDDYLLKQEYRDVAIMGGEESLDARVDALKEIPANVILVASASPEEERERYVFNSPCMSRFISNMVTRDVVVDDELLTKIIFAVFDWMGNMFKTTIPNPIRRDKEDEDAFEGFAKKATAPDMMKSLGQCSKEIKESLEQFSRNMDWNTNAMLRNSISTVDTGEHGIEISSPLKWASSTTDKDEKHPEPSGSGEKNEKEKNKQEPVENEENSSRSEERSEDGEEEPRSSNRNTKRRRTHRRRRRNRHEEDTGETDSREDVQNIEEKIREEVQRILTQEHHTTEGVHREEVSGQAFVGMERNNDIKPQHPLVPVFSSRTTVPSRNTSRAGGLSYGRIPYRGVPLR